MPKSDSRNYGALLLVIKKLAFLSRRPAGPMRFSLVSIKGAFIFATMDLIAFCALKWSVRGPRMRSNISSVVEFQRRWVLKSKIFGQESTYNINE